MPSHNGGTHNGIPLAFSSLSGAASIAQMPGVQQFAITLYAVNFNSANTDNPITVQLPTGYTRFSSNGCRISGASASLTTATCGLFTATAAGGSALVASGSAITVSTASEGTLNNAMALPATISSSQSFRLVDVPTVYFRVQTAQGSAATANVTWFFIPLP